MGNNFPGQTFSFGICQGVVFSLDKIHCLDPSKQHRTLVNLWKLVLLATQIQNAKKTVYQTNKMNSMKKFASFAIHLGPKLAIIVVRMKNWLWKFSFSPKLLLKLNNFMLSTFDKLFETGRFSLNSYIVQCPKLYFTLNAWSKIQILWGLQMVN